MVISLHAEVRDIKGRDDMNNLTKILIWILFILSAGVAVNLVINHAPIWQLIAAYWITLTVKNAIDVAKVVDDDV